MLNQNNMVCITAGLVAGTILGCSKASGYKM